jgi:hypothetical protein
LLCLVILDFYFFQIQAKEERQRVSDIQKNDKREILEIKQNAETMIAQVKLKLI